MRSLIKASLLALLVASAPAFSLTLDDARAQGRIGETLSGYVAARQQDGETLALVEQINAARVTSYQQLAENNDVAINDVAKLAGQKLVARAKSGEYVRGINGQWLKKS